MLGGQLPLPLPSCPVPFQAWGRLRQSPPARLRAAEVLQAQRAALASPGIGTPAPLIQRNILTGLCNDFNLQSERSII